MDSHACMLYYYIHYYIHIIMYVAMYLRRATFNVKFEDA